MLEKVMELHFLLYAMMLMGGLGALGMLTTHLTYRRMIRKNTEVKSNLKEKWTNLWKTRDRLLNRMNRFVWYPSLFCIAFLGLAFFLYSKDARWDGMPLAYLYVAALRKGLNAHANLPHLDPGPRPAGQCRCAGVF